jgi:hypothetical protein
VHECIAPDISIASAAAHFGELFSPILGSS